MAFGGRGIFDDPFFGGMHRQMRSQMRQMDDLMNHMMSPFGMTGDGLLDDGRRGSARELMIEDAPETGRRGRSSQIVPHRRGLEDEFDSMLMPFGGGLLGGGLFGGMRGMMQNVEGLRDRALADPNAHVYSHSTVVSVGPDGVRENTDSVRKAGHLKEVRKTMRDSKRGEEKMSIGHHMGDRAHVIEKRRDHTGNIVQNHKFTNLPQQEAESFDREWSSATRDALRTDRRLPPARALEEPRRSAQRVQEEVESAPIIEVPDEDGPTPVYTAPGSQRRRSLFNRLFRERAEPRRASPYSRKETTSYKKGPIIEELQDA